MKPLIITLATLLLLSAAWVTTNDINMANNQRALLKNIAEEASAAGSQHFEVTHYGYGERVFNETETLKAIKHMIQTNMHLDDTMAPNPNAYWQSPISYTVWIIDDIKTAQYVNGVEVSRISTTHYPVILNDPEISHGDTIVSNASVVVKIDAGKAMSRNRLIPFSMKLIRSGSYQWQHRY